MTACAEGGGEADTEGVTAAVEQVASGLAGRDGATVCSRLHRSVQDALVSRSGAADCIKAVAGGEFDQALLTSAGDVDRCEVTMGEEVAEVSGVCADALSKILGTDGIWLSEFDGDWMVQVSSDKAEL